MRVYETQVIHRMTRIVDGKRTTDRYYVTCTCSTSPTRMISAIYYTKKEGDIAMKSHVRDHVAWSADGA